MDRGDRLAREMQERVNDGRLRELEGLRHRLNRIADDDEDDYYSDEKMKERFRQEPPDEFVCGVALPKTNGVRWWTPAGCPPWIELLFMGVQWFQTISIFAYPVFLYRSFGLVPLLLRIWLIVPLGQHLEYSFMDSGANKGTAFGTVQCLYVASYLFAATVFRCVESYFGRPTPSTRCCLRSCVCSMAWSFQAVDATLSPWPRRLEAWRFKKVHAIFLSNLTHLLASAQVDRDDWPVLGYCLLFVMYLWAVGFGTCMLEASIGRSLWAACAVYTQLLCSVVRRVRDRTWPDPRGIWSILTWRYALLAIILFATWVGMGMLGHALEAREKEKKSRWDRDEQGRVLRKRLAQLLGVTEEDLDDIAKPGDGASAEVVAKRLGERLRMGNEDRRARRDAEQRVKDAAREVQKELMKLNAFAATARREASELDRKRPSSWGEDDSPSMTPRASKRVCGTTPRSSQRARPRPRPRRTERGHSGWARCRQPACFGKGARMPCDSCGDRTKATTRAPASRSRRRPRPTTPRTTTSSCTPMAPSRTWAQRSPR